MPRAAELWVARRVFGIGFTIGRLRSAALSPSGGHVWLLFTADHIHFVGLVAVVVSGLSLWLCRLCKVKRNVGRGLRRGSSRFESHREDQPANKTTPACLPAGAGPRGRNHSITTRSRGTRPVGERCGAARGGRGRTAVPRRRGVGAEGWRWANRDRGVALFTSTADDK